MKVFIVKGFSNILKIYYQKYLLKELIISEFTFSFIILLLYLQPASLIRPAPTELPQDRKIARVCG